MFQPVRRQQDTNSSLSLVPSTSDPVASSSHQASLSTPALPPSDTTAPSSSAVQETASSSTVYEPPANSSSEPISTSSIVPSSTSAPSFNPPPPPSSSDPTPPSSTPYTPPYTPPPSSSLYTPTYTRPVTPTATIPYSPPPSSPPFTPSSSATPNPSTYSPWSYVPPIMSSDTLSISVSTPVQPPSSTLSSSTPAPSGPSSTLTTMSTPQTPPSSSSSTGSSSSSSSGGNGGLDTVTSTSSSGPSGSSSSSSSSTPGSSSSPSSSSSSSTPTSSSSSGGGGLDTVTSTSSASSSSSPSDTGGSTPSSSPQNDSATPTRTPTTTFSTPVSLTMTNSQGSVFVTSPSEITTVVVTTVPNGSFTTLTEIIANPPGVLNSGDRSPASNFFKNRGAVAGVFVTAALALCAMILFVVFALRRRRQRLKRERDAEIAAGLAAAAMSQRFTDDGDHPVVMRSVPSSRLAMRRSPLPDDEDDDERIAYSSTGAPIMYSNPHMMPMAITRDTAYPISPARYGALGAAAAANRSRTPSPSKDPFANPIVTTIEPASPVANANSGWPSYGALYAGQRSQSVSPVPTTSAPASAHHGTNFGAATSTGHAPSSYHTVPPYRPPTTASSSGKDGSSGSGGSTSVPGTIQPPVPMTMTTTSRSNLDRSSSPALSSVYPPEYEQFASVENGSGNDVGYAYEPEPVQHSRQITAGMLPVPGFDSPRQSNDDDEAYSGIRSPLSGSGIASGAGAGGADDLGRTASVGSRSMYSQDASAEWDEHDRMPREDPRLDPLMRMHGGLVSAASMGQTDHLDYMRRVQPQALNSPSTVSHSQSTH